MKTRSAALPRAAGEAHPPILWRVRGHYAGLDWDAVEDRYTASVPTLPGVSGRGRDRTAALRDLDRKLAQLLEE